MKLKLKKNKENIFCIGFNKTGTTSLGYFFEQNGFIVSNQRQGELLLDSYLNRDFNTIIKFCSNKYEQVYQDVPFSLPYTFQHLDNAFTNSKFILTVRDSPEVWYNSLLKFHSDLYNSGLKPTYENLVNFNYVYKGWSWKLLNDVYFNDNEDIYNFDHLIKVYDDYNKSVISYFKNKPDKLIIINLSVDSDYQKLCKFLDINTKHESFPKISSNNILQGGDNNCKFLRN